LIIATAVSSLNVGGGLLAVFHPAAVFDPALVVASVFYEMCL
jgi:hypothetical protein